MVNIAVMGYGTVGSGVVEVINTNGKRINQRVGDEINIKYVPVSYTHLDVYKRQAFGGGDCKKGDL